MAIIFCDGFDHYPAADVTIKWDDEMTFLGGVGVSAGCGRNGTAGYNLTGCVANYLWKAFPSGPISTFTIGAGLNPTNGIGMSYPFLQVFKFTAFGQKLCGLGVSSDMQLFVNGFSSGTMEPIAYATEPIRSQMFQYLEMQVIGISNTTGQMIVRLNGREVINVSNVKTDGDTGYTSAHAFWLGGAGYGYGGALSILYDGPIYYDDVYVTDTSDDSGAGNTGFLGDVRIEELMPNADGHYLQWDVLTGSTHHEMVNQNPHDDDTTYVSTRTVGTKDTYTFPSVTPTFGNVKGVCVNFVARKTDAGDRSIAAIGTYSTTEAVGTEVDLGTEYIVHQSYMELCPDGTTWTIPKVNNSEFGPIVTR